ncbi:MAG: hypothetical protein IH612_05130 [Desulfofustis sp.]|nr:hypothetical protein [Desulfofustis sp.]
MILSRISAYVWKNWFLIGACLFLCAAYYYSFVDRAVVDLSITVEKRTFFRLYWAASDQEFSEARQVRVLVNPDRRDYRFYLTDLGGIDRLRVDPHDFKGKSTIHRLVFSQKGWKPIDIGSNEDGFSSLQPLSQVAVSALQEDGLHTVSSGNDPNYLYLPVLEPVVFGWPGEICRLLAMFLLLYGGSLLAGRLFPKMRYVPVFLAVAVGLTLTMAVISAKDVHPDETVHIEASRYYVDHWLPPVVDSDEIRNSYSRYGVSRLNGLEPYYLLAGKFGTLLEALQLPSYLSFRLFNVALLCALFLLSVRYAGMRVMAAVLLISPQLWYVFGYCNSDAFAVFVGIIACWQVADPASVVNRYLDGEDEHRWLAMLLAAALIGMLLVIKKNFLPLTPFLLVMVLIRIFRREDKALIVQSLSRLAVPCLIGLTLVGGRLAADWWVNGFDSAAKVEAMRVEMAEPLFNPATPVEKRHVYLNMKERGVTLSKIIHTHRWLEKTFRSGFGVYGYMTVSASHVFYDLVRWAVLALLAFVVGSVLLRGKWHQRLIMVGALLFSLALVWAALYHAWTADFQAQGRYLFPVALMIAAATLAAERALERKMLCFLLTMAFSLSCYSFIVVGIDGIVKIV